MVKKMEKLPSIMAMVIKKSMNIFMELKKAKLFVTLITGIKKFLIIQIEKNGKSYSVLYRWEKRGI